MEGKIATVNQEGFTSCCKAMTTFCDSVECCKGCWEEVTNETTGYILIIPPKRRKRNTSQR